MKNFILFALFCIVLIAGATFFSSSFYNDAILSVEETTSIKLKMVTGAVTSELSEIFIESGRNIQLIAALFDNDFEVSKEKLSNIYYKYLKNNSFLTSFGFLNKKGTMEVIVPEKFNKEKGNNYSFRSYFSKAKTTKNLVYSQILENYRPNNKEEIYETIVLALPVYSNNIFNGAFFGQLDVLKIQNTFKQIVHISGNNMIDLYFYDQKENKIICDSELLEDKKFENFLENRMTSYNKGINIDNINTYNGNKYFVEIKPVQDLNNDNAFFMIGIIPYSKVIGFFSKFSARIMYLAIFITLIVVIALVILVYNQKVIRGLTSKIKILEISINEVTKKQNIDEITESEYFKELKEKISKLQNNSQ